VNWGAAQEMAAEIDVVEWKCSLILFSRVFPFFFSKSWDVPIDSSLSKSN